jgi:hypothetical protein
MVGDEDLFRFQSQALLALQEAAEAYIVGERFKKRTNIIWLAVEAYIVGKRLKMWREN